MLKKTLAMAVGLMCFSLVLGAKGKPQAEQLSAVCSDLQPGFELCTATAINLVPGKAYQIQITTNCANFGYFSGVADSTGTLIFTETLPETEAPGYCSTNLFLFYLFGESSHGTPLKLVAQAIYFDNE